MITIIPAIDLKGGCCVRLRQGVAADSKVYSEDPVAMARHWQKEGAERLHVVDLDGAFNGKPVHTRTIWRIVRAVSIPVEAGGGLRTDKDVRKLLDCGVDRVVIGTRAFADPASLKKLAGQFGERIAVGIDARMGMVQVKGWIQATDMKAIDLAARVDAAGIRTIIYTDTARDGMLEGANVQAVGEICGKVTCDVIASGGITSVADVRALRKVGMKNLVGAIVGKALYEGKVTLKELSVIGS